MPRVHINGAGPVGLLLAIELKLRGIDVRISERNEEYERNHNVSIEKSSLANSHPNPEFQALLQELKLPGLVPTSLLEQKFKTFACKLGVEIIHEKTMSANDLPLKYPDTDIFIGADGAHSIIRKEIFGEKIRHKQDFQQVAEVKYKVEGKTRAFSIWTEILHYLLKVQHLVMETVGKEHAGNTNVTLRVFLNDKAAFETLNGATQRKPFRWTDEYKKKMDPRMVETIDTWIREREKALGDKIVPDSIKITPLTLGTYKSENVVIEINEKIWILVGDAAFGVPYFRSLNNGWLCAIELAKDIDAFFKDQLVDKAVSSFEKALKIPPFKAYEHYVNSLSQYENLLAQVKGTSINFAISKLDMSRSSVHYAKKGYEKSKASAASLKHSSLDLSSGMSKMFTTLYNSYKSVANYVSSVSLSKVSHIGDFSKRPNKA